MDAVGSGEFVKTVTATASQIMTFRWDQPYRWAASILAILTAVGWEQSTTPVAALSSFFSSVENPAGAKWLDSLDRWLRAHLNNEPVAAAIVVAIVFGIVAVYWGELVIAESRAAPTILIAVSLLSYNSIALPWTVAAAIVTATLFSLWLHFAGSKEHFFTVGEWWVGLLAGILCSVVWSVLSFCLWAFTRGNGLISIQRL